MIRQQFKTEREKKGYSRSDLETLTNSSSGEISRFENGKSNPTLKKIENWLNALKSELMIVSKIDTNAIVEAAKKVTSNENIFKLCVLKIRDLEKQFDTLDNENIKQQLCGYIMYQIERTSHENIIDFVNVFFDFYKQEYKELSHADKKHAFINQFVFCFRSDCL